LENGEKRQPPRRIAALQFFAPIILADWGIPETSKSPFPRFSSKKITDLQFYNATFALLQEGTGRDSPANATLLRI
jgi:hypothetical protein